jgi:hypothetical protein
MHNLIFFQEDDLLLANDFLFGEYLLSTALPANQWEAEVRNLFNISLTAYLTMVKSHAAMPNLPITSNSSVYDYIIKESAPDSLQICNNQKIQTTEYYSFNIFGLAFIMALGLAVILVSYVLPTASLAWRSRKGRLTMLAQYRQDGWKYDDLLFLDSLALEAHGVGPWRREYGIPIPHDVHDLFVPPWIGVSGKDKE